ncbi:hypothetical protein [Sphingomonas montana]|uniref:hypothetical protein n=1 Tax=Sphingomonas montana TaxID=1843236 RepID=UPI0013ED529E|nr:hypothetical protein [Sphingomonas montana]
MTDDEMTAYENRLAGMSDVDVIALWDAVDGDPTEEQVLALGEIERRNLDL